LGAWLRQIPGTLQEKKPATYTGGEIQELRIAQFATLSPHISSIVLSGISAFLSAHFYQRIFIKIFFSGYNCMSNSQLYHFLSAHFYQIFSQ